MPYLANYQKFIRPKILTGDVILWKGSGIISKMIMHWTPYSHGSLCVVLDKYERFANRIFLVEALSTGLEFRLLSERLKSEPNSEAYWLSASMDEAQQGRAREFALTECAKAVRYDYGSIFRNIFARVSSDANSYFCSEFIFFAWAKAMLPGVSVSDPVPRPGDLAGLIGGSNNLWKIF